MTAERTKTMTKSPSMSLTKSRDGDQDKDCNFHDAAGDDRGDDEPDNLDANDNVEIIMIGLIECAMFMAVRANMARRMTFVVAFL